MAVWASHYTDYLSGTVLQNLIFALPAHHPRWGREIVRGGSIVPSFNLPLTGEYPFLGLPATRYDDSADRFIEYGGVTETSTFTWVAWVRLDSGTVTARDAVSRGNLGGTNGAFSLGTAASSPLNYRAAIRLNNTIFAATASYTISTGRWDCIGIVFTGSAIEIWVNGRRWNATAVTQSWVASGVTTMRFGMRNASGAARWNGVVGPVFGWSRALSPGEMARIGQDWRLEWFAPPLHTRAAVFYVDAGSTGGYSASVELLSVAYADLTRRRTAQRAVEHQGVAYADLTRRRTAQRAVEHQGVAYASNSAVRVRVRSLEKQGVAYTFFRHHGFMRFPFERAAELIGVAYADFVRLVERRRSMNCTGVAYTNAGSLVARLRAAFFASASYLRALVRSATSLRGPFYVRLLHRGILTVRTEDGRQHIDVED